MKLRGRNIFEGGARGFWFIKPPSPFPSIHHIDKTDNSDKEMRKLIGPDHFNYMPGLIFMILYDSFNQPAVQTQKFRKHKCWNGCH